MDELAERYDLWLAAAWILGHARRTGMPELPVDLRGLTAGECSLAQLAAVVRAGQDAGLRLYPFKRSKRELPRVRRTVGFLRSLQFDTILDVGSGRGVFLIPFMREFPWVSVTALDLLDKRVNFLRDLADGGLAGLSVERLDVCEQPFPDDSFDVVTMLEVLEHIPRVERAIAAAVRMACQYVVITVPSKPDDNPEHIHLLTRARLTELFGAAGCTRLHFDGVEEHLFMVATKG